MLLKLNPELKIDELSSAFSKHKKLRIENFLTEESAELMFDTLMHYTAWHLVYSDEQGLPVQINNVQLEQLSGQQINETFNTVYQRATDRYQYIYKFFPIIDAIKQGKLTDKSVLYKIANFFNGSEFIKFSRQLTDTHTLVKVDTQSTLYEYGHFLNIHDDSVGDLDPADTSVRRYAMVFGLTKNWLPNWGGQTNFFEDGDNKIAESWLPGFNTLTIFQVPVRHSVSYITPFAPVGRYSITGWLRDDPALNRDDLET